MTEGKAGPQEEENLVENQGGILGKKSEWAGGLKKSSLVRQSQGNNSRESEGRSGRGSKSNFERV